MHRNPAHPFPHDKASVRLSKSKYLSGLQCHKRLYLETHAPELATDVDGQTRAVLDLGTAIGELARQRFPGGVLVEASHRQTQASLQRTQELLSDLTIPAIFEGAIQFAGVLVRVDVLERVVSDRGAPKGWKLIEVKASTRVKDVHLDDLAVQAHVLTGAGLKLDFIGIMHINTQYHYSGGDLELQELFSLQDLTTEVYARMEPVPGSLEEMMAMLSRNQPPDIVPSGHCHTPYSCNFWNHCTREKPDRWIYHLPGQGKVQKKLTARGIESIDDIPEDFKLSIVQRRMKDNVEWISPRLKSLLEEVQYPVHHLDFETFMPAIPRFPATRPYQSIPVQWSNHIQDEDGLVTHQEYLYMAARDPREELTHELLASLGKEGSICVYSGYERAMLERLAEAVPQLQKDIHAVIRRLWDLFPVIRDHYYHPDFKGSYSIKSVLPALVPELSYLDLEIREGGIAAQMYERMVFHETDWVEKMTIREALLKYCQRDTLALIEIRRVLKEKTNSRT